MDAISYQKYVQDPESRYLATISGLAADIVPNGQVAGVLTDTFAIAGQNSFNSLRSELEDIPLVGTAVSLGNKIAKGAKLFSGKTFQLELEQTRKVWQESGIPSISVNLSFYALKSGDLGNRPIDKMRALYSSLFPRRVNNTFLLNAPLGYKWNEGETLRAEGTLRLSIGKWFKAQELVATGANFTPSKEVMRDGSPLYITGSIDLEPYRMITYDEFLLWFLNPYEPNTTPAQTNRFGQTLNLGDV